MTAPDPPLPNDSVLDAGPILLYDGECGVCSGSVQWILEHERRDTLRFAALQSDVGQRLRQAASVSEDVDSVLWVEREGASVVAEKWSRSVLRVLKYVGGPWKLLMVIWIVPRPLRDLAYRLFARHRQLVAPKACLLPPPETRQRFL